MKSFISFLVLMNLTSFLLSQGLDLKENKEFSDLGEYVRQAEFSPFRNYFVFTIGNNTIRVFDVNWEKIYEHQGNPDAVGGVFAFSPDEKYLAFGRYKGNNDIAILRLEDLQVIQVLNGHSDYVNRLQFSHSGEFLASVSSDNSLIVWKIEDESVNLSQRFDGFEGSLEDVSFNSDDKMLATGDTRGTILILRRSGDGYESMQELQYRKHSIESISFNPLRNEFVTGSSYGIRRYRMKKDQFVLSDSLYGGISVRFPLNWSPDGKYFAFGNYQSAMIVKADDSSMHPVDYVFRHMQDVFGASFSEDGNFFCTYGSDQRVIIWEISHVTPSARSRLVSWLGADLSLAQRRALTPVSIERITGETDPQSVLPRDEFETSAEYEVRMARLSDKTLRLLQEEMERRYEVKRSGEYVQIPIQSIVGYNADLKIYKIRFMETEAGVSIPIPAARKLKEDWKRAYVRAVRSERTGEGSSAYGSFELFNPSDRMFYEVTPVENPFHLVEPEPYDRMIQEAAPTVEAPPSQVGGVTYALLFATNVYDYFDDLINPVLDAQTIAAELSESYGVASQVLVNPTLSETAAKIREYASRKYNPDDNLMIFFAGHGIYDEVFREGYVISRDSKMNDPGKTSYLSHSNLRTMINNIPCSHIFLVMDVCFGGTFDPHLASSHRGTGIYGDIPMEEFVQRKLKYKTRLYLTSGGKEYVPDGRPGFHSPFARRFIESLRYYGGDDGVLTTAEILQFVEKVNPQPRFGEFGDNEPGSDFILLMK